MLNKMISERNLPPLLSRKEMLLILQKEVYGKKPSPPENISFTVEKNYIPNFCAGKAICNKITAVCTIGSSVFSFPFYSTIPTDDNNSAFWVLLFFC